LADKTINKHEAERIINEVYQQCPNAKVVYLYPYHSNFENYYDYDGVVVFNNSGDNDEGIWIKSRVTLEFLNEAPTGSNNLKIPQENALPNLIKFPAKYILSLKLINL